MSPPRLAILCDYPEENWVSMNLVAEMLQAALELAFHDWYDEVPTWKDVPPLPDLRDEIERRLLVGVTAGRRAADFWRLGLLLGGANLVLLGIGLSVSNPRHPSNWNMLFALLSFVVYYNVINLTQAWVGSGKVSMGTALVVAHGRMNRRTGKARGRSLSAVVKWMLSVGAVGPVGTVISTGRG